ncbi:MAG: phenylacetate--CoA ligase family protein [Nitrospinota bacterium]
MLQRMTDDSQATERDGSFYEPEVEALSRDALQELQLRRLHEQVRRCYDRSAFYREKFQAVGFEPGDLRSLDDLNDLPFVHKQELRDEQAAHPPFGRYVVSPLSEVRELHPSTGTTGNPVHTLWTFNDAQTIGRFTARMLWQAGARPGDVIQNAFSYGLWIAGMAVHYAAEMLRCFVVPIGATMTERQIWYFQNAGSTVFLATPSYALHIAERIREEGVNPRALPLRIGLFGGEGGTETEGTRGKIEAGLAIDALDIYGLSEIHPTCSAECPAKAGLHWTEDHHLIEVVDPETFRPVPEGQTGVMVITHLTREASPMIRYWTNDYARLDTGPCACGRTHARSPGGILGRHDDMVVYRGAKFYPIQVEDVIRGMDELGDEFQIVLSKDKRSGAEVCTVLAEPVPGRSDVPALRERVRQRLREALLVTPQVDLKPFGTLERTTHKAKRLRDERT